MHTFQVTFPKNSDIYYSGIYDLLKDSCYPYYHSSQVYDHAPYYRCLIGDTDLILPIQVVNTFFYYQSTKCIHYITESNVWEFFLNLEKENGEVVIPFYGNYSLNEFVFFSNMLLIQGNEKMNYIRKITSELKRKSISTQRSVSCYMRGRFPFNGDVKLNIIGQYITSNKLGVSKFIVYEILELISVSCPVHNVSRFYLNI